MNKCTGCGRLKFFGSFPRGLCPDCTRRKLLAERRADEERARRIAEEAAAKRAAVERAKREAEEAAARIAAAEKAKHDADLAAQKAASQIKLPSDKHFSYGYDEHMYIPDEAVRELPGFIKNTKLSVSMEPDNPHDHNAVSLSLNGHVVGYLYRGARQDMANDFLKRGDFVIAMIDDVGTGNQASIRIEFFDDLGVIGHMLKKFPSAKTYRLTANANRDMQDNIYCCVRGDVCDISYDYDKEKYLVSDGGDIGYLPVSAGKIVEQYGEGQCVVIVADTGTTDSGKDTVSVYVFPHR